MKPIQRDPGLQPERTSLAWLRTHLVLFALGGVLLKVSEHYSSLILAVNGVVLACFAVCFACYSRKRFSVLFDSHAAVSHYEAHIKKWLSLLIFISAMLYGIVSFLRYYL